MAAKFHPDKVHHLGIEFQKMAEEKFKKLYRNKENIKFVLDAQFGATNEPMGTC